MDFVILDGGEGIVILALSHLLGRTPSQHIRHLSQWGADSTTAFIVLGPVSGVLLPWMT